MPGLAEALAQLAPTDLKSLLLHVFEGAGGAPRSRRRCSRSTSATGPSPPRPPTTPLDAAALRAAEGFEPVEHAPVSPLGLNAVLGRIHQNNVLSTIRNTEVVADPDRGARARVPPCAAGATRPQRFGCQRRAGAAPAAGSRPARLHAALPDLRARDRRPRAAVARLRGRRRSAEHFAVYRRLLGRARDRGLPLRGGRGAAARHPRHDVRPTEPPLNPTTAARCCRSGPPTARGSRTRSPTGGRIDWTQRLLSNRKERPADQRDRDLAGQRTLHRSVSLTSKRSDPALPRSV